MTKEKPWQQDMTLLTERRYKEWFYQGLDKKALSFIRNEQVNDYTTLVCEACKKRKPTGAFNIGTISDHHSKCNKCTLNQTQRTEGRWQNEEGVLWHEQAACAGAHSELFFVESQSEFLDPDAGWRGFCPGCPVADLCAEYAVNSKSVGIFGGKFYSYRAGARVVNDTTTARGRGRPKKAA